MLLSELLEYEVEVTYPKNSLGYSSICSWIMFRVVVLVNVVIITDAFQESSSSYE